LKSLAKEKIMGQLKVIGKTGAKLMRTEMQEALDIIGENYGLAFSIGRITFDDTTIRTTVEAGLTTMPGETKMSIDFRNSCHKHNLKASDLGRVFTNTRLERFTIVGLKPRNRKYPIIGQRVSDGKQFKFTSHAVRLGLLAEE
jgi:hypothetical protein